MLTNIQTMEVLTDEQIINKEEPKVHPLSAVAIYHVGANYMQLVEVLVGYDQNEVVAYMREMQQNVPKGVMVTGAECLLKKKTATGKMKALTTKK